MEEKQSYGIKQDFTLMAILLIPVAVALNIVGGQLVLLLKLPIFLDAVGTILVSILAGPWVGALTGLITNLINGIFAPQLIPYAIVNIAIGLTAGFLARARMFTSIGKVVISGIVIGLVAAVISAPITAYVFGGSTGNGASIITGVFLAAGQNLLQSVLTSGIITDLSDKVISTLICFLIIKGMSDRYLSKFSLGMNFMKNKP